MNVEQDYIMRMIKEFANVLGRLLFNDICRTGFSVFLLASR